MPRPPPPTPDRLRRLALENLLAGDWRAELCGWWIVCVRRPRQRKMRPYIAVPPCWLLTAARYAQIDVGDAPLVIDNVSVAAAPQSVYDELVAHLREQCEIDRALASIASAAVAEG